MNPHHQAHKHDRRQHDVDTKHLCLLVLPLFQCLQNGPPDLRVCRYCNVASTRRKARNEAFRIGDSRRALVWFRFLCLFLPIVPALIQLTGHFHHPNKKIVTTKQIRSLRAKKKERPRQRMADMVRNLRQKLEQDEPQFLPSPKESMLFKKLAFVFFVFTATAILVGRYREPPRTPNDDPLFQPL